MTIFNARGGCDSDGYYATLACQAITEESAFYHTLYRADLNSHKCFPPPKKNNASREKLLQSMTTLKKDSDRQKGMLPCM